ncbi:YfhO family protein [Enterococcus ureasiticus]|nr:YfhO family protein [Enterococcus ureasiticus]
MGLNFGYGADLFYPSILLLPFAFFRIVGIAFVPSYYLYQLLISLVTAASAYYFLYSIKKSQKLALLFSCFYTLSTYRLIDQSVRAALGETLAFAFLPLFILGVYSIFYSDKHRWQLLGIGMSLLIASHLITAFYSFILLLIFILINWKKCKLAQIKSLIMAGLLSLGLSAWFLFPYLEQIHHLTFNFNNTTLWANGLKFSLGDLFINSLANLSAPFTELKPNIGLLLLVAVLIAGFNYRKLSPSNKRLSLATLAVILLATNIFPWGLFKVSILATIQFPWRLLLFASFFSSLLAVCLIEEFRLLSRKDILVFIALSGFLTLGFNINNLSQSNSKNNVTVTNENFTDFYESEIGHGKEYLVKDTDFKKHFASPGLIIDGIPYTDSSRKVENNYNYSTFNVRINGTQEVQLPKFYYEGYEVKLDQQVIRNYNKNGLVTVKLEQGLHEISVTYKKTVIQKVSAIFSVLLAGLLIFYNIIKSRRKNK